ncbi:MAG: XTP/dITP diphosphatase [Firmicutes bacterium]|nr:XTP/dITP diphosphatase [Bacillota bacterium]
MKLIIASTNKGKIQEFKSILAGSDLQVIGMEEVGIAQGADETADTFEGNAMLKAKYVSALCGEAAVADDSGLCVQALGGAPGVYSARYSGENAADHDNNLKLLAEMEKETNRDAKFVCAIAVAHPNGKTQLFKGELKGKIAFEMKGKGGFGYDCLFYLPQYKMTSAEIPPELKNKISHRAKALFKLKNYLLNGK